MLGFSIKRKMEMAMDLPKLTPEQIGKIIDRIVILRADWLQHVERQLASQSRDGDLVSPQRRPRL